MNTSGSGGSFRRSFLAQAAPLLAAARAAANSSPSTSLSARSQVPATRASNTGVANRPNIILCMGDDHGWHETGYYKHPYLRTPALDEMASHGLRFDRFYAAAPVCSPTRGSVMTGRHPNRYGAFFPNFSIRPQEVAIPQLLRRAGYVCGHFGKWHLGPVRAGSPTNPGAMGFDGWVSTDNFFGYNPRLSRNGGPPEIFRGEGSEIVVEQAIPFITGAAKDRQPFFAVVWFGSPHQPYSGIDEDLIPFRKVDERLAQRFAEITAMDRAIGQLRRHLQSENIADNTLVWYCSDNGTPQDVCVHTNLRGSKGNLYEGGIRVPGIIEWPARLRQSAVTQFPAVTSDILPTLCELLGLPLPGRPIDGISLVPCLKGELAERPQPICFWQYDRQREEEENPGQWIDPELQRGVMPTAFVRQIQFRNHLHRRARTSDFGGEAAVVGNQFKLVAPKSGQLELYDLRADPAEARDLARKQPAVVSEMEKVLRGWQRSVEVSLTGADYVK